MWVKFRDCCFLLGADLEVYKGSPDKESSVGWGSVLSSHIKPTDKAIGFKIPHHGSENGYSEDVWNELVFNDAISAITPYSRSGLPKAPEIARLKNHTSNIVISSNVSHRLTKRDRTVEKTMLNVVNKRKVLWGKARFRYE